MMSKLQRKSSSRKNRTGRSSGPPQTLVKKFQADFLNLDADGDGNISTEEMSNVLRSLQITLKLTDADVNRIIREMDKDGNGIIEVSEYFRYMRGKNEQDAVCRALCHQSQLYKEFQRFDKDGSGFITEDELVDVLRSATGMEFSNHQLKEVLRESDTDNDGKINFFEFAVFMAK